MLISANCKPNLFHLITYLLLSISCLLLGSSILNMGHHQHFDLIIDLFSMSHLFPDNLYYRLAGLCFLLVGSLSLLTSFLRPQLPLTCLLEKGISILLICMAIPPLISLVNNAVWIADLGGFPAIGAGQGIIKYWALLAIGITLLFQNKLSSQSIIWINFSPIAIVLLWIGGMKFTAIEANGIQTLIASSPFMSWMYSMWSIQTTSNLIGIYDILATLLLCLGIIFRQFMLIFMLPALMVFLTTQTFIFSWDSALSSTSILTTGGQFLIKDLWFIINLIFILLTPLQTQNN